MKYTYFAWSAELGLMKIGMSKRPAARIKTLTSGVSVSTPERVAVVKADDLSEKEAHIAFDETRIAGEWFAASPEEVLEFLSDLSIDLVEFAEPVKPIKERLVFVGFRIPKGLGLKMMDRISSGGFESKTDYILHLMKRDQERRAA